jgi:uncharacterized membrane protein HdeD (DUF308 family)
VNTIGAVLALASASGINAYAALLALGLSVKFDLVPLSGKITDFFGQDWVLVLLGLLYLLEFFADKIPAVDHVWDLIHTFIRPVAGAVVAVAIVTGSGEGWVVLAALIGGVTSLLFHTAKSASRVAVNTGSAGTLGWVVSLAEDFLAIMAAIIALFWPMLAVAILLVVLGAWYFMRKGRPAEA